MKIFERESKTYDFLNAEGTFQGNLVYENWLYSSASISTQYGEFYDLKTVGFWTSKVEARIGNELYAELHRNWRGEAIIDITNNDIEKDYIVKHKGFWKSRYVMQDRHENDIATFIPEYEWFGKTHFNIEINPTQEHQAQEVLILLALFSILGIKRAQQSAAS